VDINNQQSTINNQQSTINNQQIIGFEALLRWNNPSLGQVSPIEFIPIAENNGLIIPIGQFVLEQALHITALWQQKYNQSFSIAVNLSPQQFRDPDLLKYITTALQKSGIKSGSLELEITEGVLMSDHAYIKDTMSALTQLDVKIAMDDFGTGYSSLSYLRNYPFHTLKIDREFINNITINTADQGLTKAAITMAHSLGLKVVAEGIETEGQLALLALQDCDIAQGFLFCKPLSPEQMSSMLKEKSNTNANKQHS